MCGGKVLYCAVLQAFSGLVETKSLMWATLWDLQMSPPTLTPRRYLCAALNSHPLSATVDSCHWGFLTQVEDP